MFAIEAFKYIETFFEMLFFFFKINYICCHFRPLTNFRTVYEQLKDLFVFILLNT